MSQVAEVERTEEACGEGPDDGCNSSNSNAPCHRQDAGENNSTPRCEHLRRFDMNGWRPDPALTDDENYMDMTMVVTRNSLCLQGYMGCVLVNPGLLSGHQDGAQGGHVGERRGRHESRLYAAVIGAATNAPLYAKLDSDIHAEVAALGEASRRGNSTDGCTAYVTMPPCKRCFASLAVSGARRVVSVRAAADSVLKAAQGRGIEVVDLGRKTADGVTERINRLMNVGGIKTNEQLANIAEMRNMRKEEMRAKKARKRARREEMKKLHAPKKSKS